MTDLGTDLAGSLAVETHRRASNACTLACAIAEAEGHAFTELQVGYILQAVISCMDGLEASLAHHLSVDAGLRTGQMADLLRGES